MKKSVNIRVEVDILERIKRLMENSNGYVTQSKIFENGALKELAELEKIYPPKK